VTHGAGQVIEFHINGPLANTLSQPFPHVFPRDGFGQVRLQNRSTATLDVLSQAIGKNGIISRSVYAENAEFNVQRNNAEQTGRHRSIASGHDRGACVLEADC
jgi:hypothetical protein